MRHPRKELICKLSLVAIASLAAAAASAPMAWGQKAQAAETDRWLHVRVDNHEAKGEMVRVNVPLSLAEKVLPTINNNRLHNGKARIEEARVNGVNLRDLLDAVRSSKDGEYVTVEGHDSDIRMFKKDGYIEAHIQEKKEGDKTQVEIRVPLAVADALLSAGNNELDLVAAVRALSAHGDSELLMVKDKESTVRIWLDSKNTN
jgi:hypothetical protein